MHADRTNRVVLTVVSVLGVLAGAGALLAGYGVFGDRFRHKHLSDNTFVRYFHDHSDWLWPAIAGAAFIVMLLCLVWLLRLLFSTDRAGEIAIESGTPTGEVEHGRGRRHHGTGRTSVVASAVAQVVGAEIQTYHGVSGARARVLGDAQHPRLVIDITASRRADVAALVARVQNEAVTHAQDALAPARLQVKLDISVRDKGQTRAL
jgi:hypothetical protein